MVEEAVRELVKEIWNGCFGAYGGGDGAYYCGQCEREVKALAEEIQKEIKRHCRLAAVGKIVGE